MLDNQILLSESDFESLVDEFKSALSENSLNFESIIESQNEFIVEQQEYISEQIEIQNMQSEDNINNDLLLIDFLSIWFSLFAGLLVGIFGIKGMFDPWRF